MKTNCFSRLLCLRSVVESAAEEDEAPSEWMLSVLRTGSGVLLAEGT